MEDGGSLLILAFGRTTAEHSAGQPRTLVERMAEQDQGELLLTYAELSARLGVSTDGARVRAKRSGWPITMGNDGRARVRVRAVELPERPPEQAKRSPEQNPDRSELLVELRELLDRANSSVEQARADAEQARTETTELRVALARAEERIEAARAIAAAEIATARAETAAQQALVRELREALEWHRRPWWNRILGR